MPLSVIPGLDPGIYTSTVPRLIPGSSPGMTLIEKSLLSDPLILMPMRLVRATYRDKVFGSGGPDERAMT